MVWRTIGDMPHLCRRLRRLQALGQSVQVEAALRPRNDPDAQSLWHMQHVRRPK